MAHAAEASTPSRVIALSTGHLDHCLAMGVLPVGLAVAVSDATDSRGVPPYIREKFGDEFDLDSIEIVGERMDFSIEKVAALEPDLILSNKRSAPEFIDRLEQIGPVVLTNGGSESFKTDLCIVADALGTRTLANQLLADYEERARSWGESRGNSDSLSLVRAKGDQFLYFGTLALASIVATDARMTRPVNQQFDDNASQELAPENVNELDADWLFYAFPSGADSLTESESWQSLPVVADDRAFEVDVDPWFINASVVAAERVLDDLIVFTEQRN